MAKVITVPSLERFSQIVSVPDSIVVCCFTATWCGPCKQAWPHVEKMSFEFPSVVFLNIDIDDHPNICKMCHVYRVPTFIVVKGGKTVSSIEGADMNLLRKVVKDVTVKAGALGS